MKTNKSAWRAVCCEVVGAVYAGGAGVALEAGAFYDVTREGVTQMVNTTIAPYASVSPTLVTGGLIVAGGVSLLMAPSLVLGVFKKLRHVPMPQPK